LRGVKYHAWNTLWKTACAEYRKLRDEAQELLIAQSNICSIYDFAGGKLLRQEKEEQKR
jgi:hypothetical protein